MTELPLLLHRDVIHLVVLSSTVSNALAKSRTTTSLTKTLSVFVNQTFEASTNAAELNEKEREKEIEKKRGRKKWKTKERKKENKKKKYRILVNQISE